MAVSFNPVGDFELIADGLAEHTLIDREGVPRVLSKVLRQEIDRKEVWASNGNYRQGDAVFHLSTTECADEPQLGWTLRPSDDVTSDYTILSVVKDTMGDRWECVGRNLAVSEGLTERITILKAGEVVQSASGALKPSTWFAEAVDVIARVQPMQADRVVEQEQTLFIEQATCVFLHSRTIDATRRIQTADGTVWKIISVANRDRIERLFEATVEKTPWRLP